MRHINNTKGIHCQLKNGIKFRGHVLRTVMRIYFCCIAFKRAVIPKKKIKSKITLNLKDIVI